MNPPAPPDTTDQPAHTPPPPSTPPTSPPPYPPTAPTPHPPPTPTPPQDPQIHPPTDPPLIQLPISQPPLTTHHRHRTRSPHHPLREQLHHTSPQAPAPTVSFHPASTCSRSTADQHLHRTTRTSGSAATTVQHPHQPPDRPAPPTPHRTDPPTTVNRPRNPPDGPPRRTPRRTTRPGRTSPLPAVRQPHSRHRARPAAPASPGSLFCTVSITWNSGCRASDRAGASSSTSRSNGTS